ncbi:MAG: ABC transporter ATP-binding protein [Bacteroidetes bacterium]|nr:MAG: ABC transporter ATP-binding protein [Bacteroidota bacterium]
MNPIIEIQNLSKSFVDIHAVKELRLEIQSGEMFGIVGPDGAGKTTTFRMLCGIIPPTSGTATILGCDLLKETKKIRTQIGYLSQRFSLYGDLTIDENIEFFAEIHEVSNYKERREELLEFTRLTPFRTRLAEHLSGGMKQKLALVCTLIHQPKIIFLDEPTTGVDPVSRRDFWRILSSLLKQNITIVMSTPYLDEAERCNRVAMMHEGNIMVVDTTQNIRGMMKGEVLEIVCDDFQHAPDILKELSFVHGVQTFGDRLNVIVDDSRKQFDELQQRMHENNITITDWRTISPSLENVFISLLSQHRVVKERE